MWNNKAYFAYVNQNVNYMISESYWKFCFSRQEKWIPKQQNKYDKTIYGCNIFTENDFHIYKHWCE